MGLRRLSLEEAEVEGRSKWPDMLPCKQGKIYQDTATAFHRDCKQKICNKHNIEP